MTVTSVDGDSTADRDKAQPMWDEAEFAEMVRELVADTAPRVFALVEEYGEREDGWVFAWGAQFADRATLLTPDGRPLGIFGSAERARSTFSRYATIRLIWPDQGLKTGA